MDTPTDGDLILRCLDGDAEAFAPLVKRYQGAVYATAYYYVGRYDAAEDVTQEAFWAAYRSLPHLKNRNKFAPWLKEVTTRTAANWLRRNANKLRSETPLPGKRTISLEDARLGPEATASRAEQYQRVQAAIDSLPERYRLPVVLRYIQELSYDEISRFTGESRDEVRGLLHRAGRLLREALKDLTHEDVRKDDDEGDAAWHPASK